MGAKDRSQERPGPIAAGLPGQTLLEARRWETRAQRKSVREPTSPHTPPPPPPAGRGGGGGRPGSPGGGGSRRGHPPLEPLDEPEPDGGPVGHGHGHGPVELDQRGGHHPGQLPVEASDPRPVGLVGGPRLGVARRDGRLELVGSGRLSSRHRLHETEALGDREAVQVVRSWSPSRTNAPGMLEEQEGHQPEHRRGALRERIGRRHPVRDADLADLALARTSRWAIAAPGTRNARAISPVVVRPAASAGSAPLGPRRMGRGASR